MYNSKSLGSGPENGLDAEKMVDVTDGDTEEKLGTIHDQRGMIRMRKKQELRRNFHFFSIWGFAVMLGCSWDRLHVSGNLRRIMPSMTVLKVSVAMASDRYQMEVQQGACGSS